MPRCLLHRSSSSASASALASAFISATNLGLQFSDQFRLVIRLLLQFLVSLFLVHLRLFHLRLYLLRLFNLFFSFFFFLLALCGRSREVLLCGIQVVFTFSQFCLTLLQLVLTLLQCLLLRRVCLCQRLVSLFFCFLFLFGRLFGGQRFAHCSICSDLFCRVLCSTFLFQLLLFFPDYLIPFVHLCHELIPRRIHRVQGSCERAHHLTHGILGLCLEAVNARNLLFNLRLCVGVGRLNSLNLRVRYVRSPLVLVFGIFDLGCDFDSRTKVSLLHLVDRRFSDSLRFLLPRVRRFGDV
mmetsp:Transcript_15997/g.39575  ORF Transcript_15997/g.39575 Transcript_15997/m.39575 type:complete len:297 (-) Transcript_15997:522-1412(-)